MSSTARTASAKARLERGLGRRVRPAQRTPCAPKAGPPPTPPGCRSSRCWRATRRSPRADRPRAAGHRAAQPARLHPPRHALRLLEQRPALPPMGLRLRLKAGYSLAGFHGQSLVILRSAQALRADRRRQRLALVHHRRAHAGWDDEDLDSSSRCPARPSKRSKPARSCTAAARRARARALPPPLARPASSARRAAGRAAAARPARPAAALAAGRLLRCGCCLARRVIESLNSRIPEPSERPISGRRRAPKTSSRITTRKAM